MLKKIVIGVIRFYQLAISPWFPKSCRFFPTCSEYSKQAINRYGIIKGIGLGVKRIIRCNPFNSGGYDPLE